MSPGRTAVLIVLLLVPTTVAAQEVRTGAVAQSYRMQDSERVRLHDLALVTTPIEFRWPVTSRITFSGSGGYARARLRLPSGDSGAVSGSLDTRLAVDVALGAIGLSGFASLPTGNVAQTTEEATVVGALSADLLPFATTSWGTGGIYGIGARYGARVSRTAIDLSLGYAAVRGYQPLDQGELTGDADARTYQPGDLTSVRIDLERDVGEAGILSSSLALHVFGDDSYDEHNLFQPGLRLSGSISYAFPLGPREGARVFGSYLHRGAGSTDLLGGEAGQILPGARVPLARQLFRIGSDVRIGRRFVTWIPSGEFRLLRSPEGVGQGWVGSLGGRAQWRVLGGQFGQRLHLEPSAALRYGRVVPQAGFESGLWGWEVGLLLRWTEGF